MKKLLTTTLFICVVIFSSCTEKTIPITTNSSEARDLFIEGRDLMDKLRMGESFSYFERAVRLDTNFALAYLNLGIVVTNGPDRIKYIEKAKSKIDLVSHGEELLILGVETGLTGQPGKQREYFEKLIELFPEDPRTHNILGNIYFGNQEYELAIHQYKIASNLDPQFSQPYNQMGYSYRFLGDYEKAEEAFKKYVSLIPDDSNPYDSYAELLLEMGEYEVSIENYEKAIKLNPNFSNSYLGIATNLNIQGEHGLARKKLKELFYQIEDIGIRRQALGAMIVSYIDEGKYDQGLKVAEKRLAGSQLRADTLAIAGDLNLIGILLREKDDLIEADKKITEMITLVRESDNQENIKKAWDRVYYYQHTRNASLKGEIDEAWEYHKKYLQAATDAGSIGQIRAAHELAGMIFYREEKYLDSISEFEKTNLQNPYNLYYCGLAYKALGDKEAARTYFSRTAGANSFNNLNYSFVRKKAEEQLNLLRN